MSIATRLRAVQGYDFTRGDQFDRVANGAWVLRDSVAEALGVNLKRPAPHACPACPNSNDVAPGMPVCTDCAPELWRLLSAPSCRDRDAGAEDYL